MTAGPQSSFDFTAGRDINFFQKHEHLAEPLFATPALERFGPACPANSPRCGELINTLYAERLIILAGQELEGKEQIAYHLAFLLREQLTQEESRGVAVREWYRASDPQKIDLALDEKLCTILLLPTIQPHHLGYRLAKLKEILTDRQHYVIITTETSPSDWGMANLQAQEHLWIDLSWESYYGVPHLCSLLAKQIEENRENLPAGLAWKPDGPETCIVPDLSFAEVVGYLRYPEKVADFVGAIVKATLREEGWAAGKEDLMKLLNRLSSERELTLDWYHKTERDDQILSLGLFLFDGLPDYQVFAGLEVLVAQAWRSANPLLHQYDYRDLERLSQCFVLIDDGLGGARISLRSPAKRRHLLDAVWKLQRRRLLQALPTIVEMIRRSTRHRDSKEGSQGSESDPVESRDLVWQAARKSERELYEPGPRSRRFREAMVRALGEMALHSLDAVEPHLFELAFSGHYSVREVVAKTLASWREADQDQHLFRLLERWWRSAGRNGRSARSPVSLKSEEVEALRSTVALAVGFASLHDVAHLHPTLQALVREISFSRESAVRRIYIEKTLPLVVAGHLERLESLLRSRIILDNDALEAVGFGASLALDFRPEETVDFLSRWHVAAKRGPSAPADQVTIRERVISVVALAYGFFDFRDGGSIITPGEVVGKLQSILAEESHPFIRKWCLRALGRQAIVNFELVAPVLHKVVSEINVEDRVSLVLSFEAAYRNQREDLEGGDARIWVDDTSYPIWLHSGRPLTALESLLVAWLQGDEPVAQQVAVQAFSALEASNLERREREEISRLLSRPADTSNAALNVSSAEIGKLRSGGLFGSMAMYLAEPLNPVMRETVMPSLAEVIEIRRRNGNPFGYLMPQARELPPAAYEELRRKVPSLPDATALLVRWSRLNDASFQARSSVLRRAYDFYRMRWLIIGGLLLLAYVVLKLFV